jgi:excisionase family DNA binding protein
MSLIDVRRLLTIDEVADRLGVTRRTIERKIEQGVILAYQLGGPRTAIRIPADELEQWLKEPAP